MLSKSKWIIVSTGFAIFSMFFGSGNLVFPIAVGKESEGHFLLAAFGLILTGVIAPLLGALAIMLYRGDTKAFFETVGKPAAFWIPLISLSLMGPFGVLARCITVAHGSFHSVFSSTPLWAFSLVSCIVIYLFTMRKNHIIPLLGTFLTPLLLTLLLVTATFGFIGGELTESSPHGHVDAFTNGFFKGYQMMDLVASFFFSTFVIQHLMRKLPDAESQPSLSIFLKSAGLGGALLGVIYVCLSMLGGLYAVELADVPATEMLNVIAQQALGPMAAPILSGTVILACLTTGVVLASLFADFLRKDISKNKISPAAAMAVTLAISFVISTLEFSGIASFLGPILETIYPALIVLTLVNIANKLWGLPQSRWPVAATVVLKLLWF